MIVAPNYRLQALGFMALKQLALDNGPDGSEGNYGLWDQLIALQWIKRNIGQFGGDPQRVLLFGPDAASALPLALVSRKRAAPPAQDVQGRRQSGHGPDQQTALKSERDNSDDDDDNYEQLFHSVWLMNPTIYYELPYELANQHYSRLIKSQSVCSNDLSAAAAPSDGSERRPAGKQNHTERYASRLSEWRETHKIREQKQRQRQGQTLQDQGAPANASGAAERLLDCLIGLSGEQIVREYLGRDDAAFRLDDENSLPIRNIFPDQFVTIDGQLVRDSFPFLGESAPSSEPRQGGQFDMLIGSTAQAVEFWPCPRNLPEWSWSDFRHYVATSLNSFSQADETFARASELYGVPPVDCQTAAGLSPPVVTTDRRHCGLTNGSMGHAPRTAGSPMESYLTLVSDIRQVCPARELAKSLRLSGRVGSLERYVVEWRPSGQLSRSLAAGAPWRAQNASHLQHAFHYWDLLALFGFEFERQLEPAEEDLEFQRQIRAMAKRVVWRAGGSGDARTRASASSKPNDERASNQNGRAPSRSDEPFTIFTRGHQVQSDDGDSYKRRECKMWQQSLRQSYAWIS